MSARIVLSDGTEITVSTSELGEAMKQLAPWIGIPAKAPEPPNAVEGRRLAATQPGGAAPTEGHSVQSRPEPPPRQGDLPLSPSPDSGMTDRAIALLKAIRDSGSNGLPPQEVMEVVAASHPKGIGSRMQGINRTLVDLGFEVSTVYSNDRGPLGQRIWKRAAQIDDAIAALEGSVHDQ